MDRASTDSGWLTLRWEKESRYYQAYLHQDLWGGWILTRGWGGKGTRLGRVVHTPLASYEEGLAVLEQVKTRRRSRGYVERHIPVKTPLKRDVVQTR